MKAQSAIEYLMTYGWMLLVVAIAGGTIFSLVQGQGIESISGFNGQDITVDNFGLTGTGKLQLEVRNSDSDNINVNSIELEDPETGATTRILTEKNIDVGNLETFTIGGFEITDSTNKQTIRINYGAGSLQNLSVEGKINGNLKVKNYVYFESVEFNRTADILKVAARNTGNSEATNIIYTVNSDDQIFTGTLGNISPDQTKDINITIDQTYSLQNISLELAGNNFIQTESDLSCAPTSKLLGYWTLDNKNTYNNKAHDISGQNNDGQLNGVKTGVEGVNGEAHEFRGGESIVYEDNLVLERDGSAITWWMNPEGESSTGLFTDRNGIKNYISARKDTLRAETDTNCNGFYFDQYEKKTGWNHYAIVLNDSKAYAYENGNYLGEATSYGSIDCNSGEASKLLNDIILDSIGSSPKYNNDYIGKLDEIKIFNRSLNKNQVKRISQIQDEQWASNTCRLD